MAVSVVSEVSDFPSACLFSSRVRAGFLNFTDFTDWGLKTWQWKTTDFTDHTDHPTPKGYP